MSQTTTFNDGDVVILKSGGPKMTVKFTDPIMGVCCEWFDEKKNRADGYFTAATLQLYKAPSFSAVTRLP